MSATDRLALRMISERSPGDVATPRDPVAHLVEEQHVLSRCSIREVYNEATKREATAMNGKVAAVGLP